MITPLPTPDVAEAPPLTQKDIPVPRDEIVRITRLVSKTSTRPLTQSDRHLTDRHLLQLQGYPEEEVKIVHFKRGLPIRVDAHKALCEHIGYLAVKYESRKSTIYK